MSKSPSLLDQLSQAARDENAEERARLDPRWDRLAAGKLTEAEHDELLGLADASGEAQEAYQAFKPLGKAFEKRLAADLAARLAAAAAGAASAGTGAEPEPAPARSKQGGRSALLYGAFGSAAMASLAAAFFVLSVAPLPGYQYVLPPAQRDRGLTAPSSGTGALILGSSVHFKLEAAEEPGEQLEARLFVLGPDGQLRPTNLVPRIKDDGRIVDFEVILSREAGFSPGSWRLVAVLARPGKFPEPEAIRQHGLSGGKPEKFWNVVVWPIEVEKDPEEDG